MDGIILFGEFWPGWELLAPRNKITQEKKMGITGNYVTVNKIGGAMFCWFSGRAHYFYHIGYDSSTVSRVAVGFLVSIFRNWLKRKTRKLDFANLYTLVSNMYNPFSSITSGFFQVCSEMEIPKKICWRSTKNGHYLWNQRTWIGKIYYVADYSIQFNFLNRANKISIQFS